MRRSNNLTECSGTIMEMDGYDVISNDNFYLKIFHNNINNIKENYSTFQGKNNFEKLQKYKEENVACRDTN
ncbi:hypothetical protein T06_11525 [Trichinella sp. T6]|nr:hypothetical protein T06_11525 [Trichinella sp. T6]